MRPATVVLCSLASAAVLSFAPAASAQPDTANCGDQPHRETLFEWVGEWRAVDGEDREVATSQVRAVAGGCAFEEVRQQADGSSGLGLTYFDRADGVWRQRWISSLGHTALIELQFEGDQVSSSGRLHLVEGGEVLLRSAFVSRAGGGLSQELALSLDGGASYSAPEVTHYLPAGDQAAAVEAPVNMPAPEAPAPAPLETPEVTTPEVQPVPPAEDAAVADPPAAEPDAPPEAEPAGVRVRSRRKAEAPVPETAMESPMTLEFELGPLADLPPGAAWRTEELAPYVTDQVNITQVTAQRRQRRGRTELELVVNLRTRAGQSKVDLDVTLLSGGDAVATERVEGITLGKLIRAHDPTDGLAEAVRLPLEGDTFDALFADGGRPSVRLTVTVR